MTKSTYKDASNKHRVRELMMAITKVYRPKGKIVGLAGPDVEDYIKWCNSHDYTDIDVYEMNFQVMIHQIKTFGYVQPINIHYSDISKAPYKSGVFYDLDFCASVKCLEEAIYKFRRHFMMTFSTRIGIHETIDKFMKYRDEDMYTFSNHDEGRFIYTLINGKQSYFMVRYHDTSAMCTICDIPDHASYHLYQRAINLQKQQLNN
jgi:hypothetical protein